MASQVSLGETEIDKDILAVAAIDFGTSYTGYAVSFKGDEKNAVTGKHGSLLEKDRVPTNVLLNPDETFNSFGYEAENIYTKLKPDERQKHFFFRTFKMELYRTNRLSRDLLLIDTRGRHFWAATIFSMVIWHLKGLVYETIKMCKIDMYSKPDLSSDENETESERAPTKERIQWMISIPAIWPDDARQFMRYAADCAAIDETHLRFVLEPEAASMYCREQHIQITGDSTVDCLSEGHKYILADLGGGTADICVHEVLENGKLKELYTATGGDLGGTHVDSEFHNFLEKLVGEPVLSQFQDKYMSKYFNLMRTFQQEKEKFSLNTQEVHIALEYQLVKLFEKTGKNLEERLTDTRFADLVEYEPEDLDLILKAELMKHFFRSTVDGIIEKLKAIIQDCPDDKIETLLLVGGFSESQYVRERIKNEIKPLNVILQQDASLAVLKGAVMMGYKPQNIIQRRARYTYGASLARPFKEGDHPECFKYVHDGKVWCGQLFRKAIERGETLEYGNTVKLSHSRTCEDVKEKHQQHQTTLYRSTRHNPKYCTEEEECVQIGKIIEQPPREGWPDKMKVYIKLMVGETELFASTINRTTGQEYFTKLDFL